MDVVEIGSAAGEMGGVYKVKPLGVYAMVDDGEVVGARVLRTARAGDTAGPRPVTVPSSAPLTLPFETRLFNQQPLTPPP